MEKNPKPKVTLLSWTQHPIETIYSIWWASKSNNKLLTPIDILSGARDPADDIGPEKLFKKVLAQRIPVTESINFNFVMENVSVSWREQAVRHRVGHRHDDRIGVDIIPDLTSSSWWSQSMRILDMGKFAENGEYRVPDSIEALKKTNIELWEQYHHVMSEIEATYNWLVEAGVPMEDARDLMPLGAHHRISWSMNINSMAHIIGKRACWILQLGLWGPIIKGIVNELTSKVDSLFHDLVTPPCIDDCDNYKGCHFVHENERRITGEDDLPVCSLFLHNECKLKQEGDVMISVNMRAVEYKEFWGRDPWTGKRIQYDGRGVNA